jgi:hypothetical protein
MGATIVGRTGYTTSPYTFGAHIVARKPVSV